MVSFTLKVILHVAKNDSKCRNIAPLRPEKKDFACVLKLKSVCTFNFGFQKEMLKGFSGDKTHLGSAEKFLLSLVSIPGYVDVDVSS